MSSAGELFGYLASIFVFATFYVRTMLPLRMIAVASNITFMTYAYSQNLLPILILHALLLPVNLLRLHEIRKLIRLTESVHETDAPIKAILPFMKPRTLKRGEVLFEKGDFSSHMYYVEHGDIRLKEIDKIVGQGAVIGEIGLFSPHRMRTATAIAETDCRLLSVDDKTLYQSYYQNPKLGFYLIRLIASRFSDSHLGNQSRSFNDR